MSLHFIVFSRKVTLECYLWCSVADRQQRPASLALGLISIGLKHDRGVPILEAHTFIIPLFLWILFYLLELSFPWYLTSLFCFWDCDDKQSVSFRLLSCFYLHPTHPQFSASSSYHQSAPFTCCIPVLHNQRQPNSSSFLLAFWLLLLVWSFELKFSR